MREDLHIGVTPTSGAETPAYNPYKALVNFVAESSILVLEIILEPDLHVQLFF